MKSLTLVFWLDFSLLLVFAALEAVSFTGLLLHEWLGIAVSVLILVHLLLAWTWISATMRRVTVPGSGRARVNYALNASLFAAAVVVILSGLLISEAALPALGFGIPPNDTPWRGLHNRSSDVVLILAGLHLGLNWDWAVAAAKKCLGRSSS